MPSAAGAARQSTQRMGVGLPAETHEDSLTHAQHRLAELEHQLALFAQTLWRLVAEPWGMPFTPQQVKQGLCSGALKADADMVSMNGVQHLHACAIAKVWTDTKRGLKEARQTCLQKAQHTAPRTRAGQPLGQVPPPGCQPPSASSSQSTSPPAAPAAAQQHAALGAPTAQQLPRPTLSPHSLAMLGGSSCSLGPALSASTEDPQLRATMLLESLNLLGPSPDPQQPPGPPQHPRIPQAMLQGLHSPPSEPSMQAVMAAQLSADVLGRAHMQVVQFLESLGVAPGPPPACQHTPAAYSQPAGPLPPQPAASAGMAAVHAPASHVPGQAPKGHLVSSDPAQCAQLRCRQSPPPGRSFPESDHQPPAERGQLPASCLPQGAGSAMPAAAAPPPLAGGFAHALEPWMSPPGNNTQRQAELPSQPQRQPHLQQHPQQQAGLPPELQQAAPDPLPGPNNPQQQQCLQRPSFPFTTPQGRGSPQLQLGEDAQHNAMQLLEMLDLGWGCHSPAFEGHPGTMPFTPALLPLDGGASWICAPSRDEDHQATLSSRSPLKAGRWQEKAAAPDQPAAGNPAGGTPASDGSTRIGVNLSRSCSPGAEMPQGPHSLPIPDFVCQSFQQQAAGPVQQQPEAGQPPSAGSPPALKRKPGRKPKKGKGQKQPAAETAGLGKASNPAAPVSASKVDGRLPAPHAQGEASAPGVLPGTARHADLDKRLLTMQGTRSSRQRQAAAPPASRGKGADAPEPQACDAPKAVPDSTSSRTGTPAPAEQPALLQLEGPQAVLPQQQHDAPCPPTAETRADEAPPPGFAAAPGQAAADALEEPILSGISERVKGSKRRRSCTPAAPQPPAKQQRPASAGRSAKQAQPAPDPPAALQKPGTPSHRSEPQPQARRPMLPAPRPRNQNSASVMAMKRLIAPPQPSKSRLAPALSQAMGSSRSPSPAAHRGSPTPSGGTGPAGKRSSGAPASQPAQARPHSATPASSLPSSAPCRPAGAKRRIQKRPPGLGADPERPQAGHKRQAALLSLREAQGEPEHPASARSGRRGKGVHGSEAEADPGCARARPYQRQRTAAESQPASLRPSSAAAKAAPIDSTDCLAGSRQRAGKPPSRAGAYCFNDDKWAELKRSAPSLRLGRSPVEGLGLFARDAIKADTFLCEYVGELIRRPLEDAREQQWQAQGRANYLFRRDKEWVIDATKRGNHARYINHSCDGNCQSFTVTSKNNTRIIICAKRDIQPGEELCYDYKFAREPEEAAVPCYCGSSNCTGRMN